MQKVEYCIFIVGPSGFDTRIQLFGLEHDIISDSPNDYGQSVFASYDLKVN